MRSIVFGSEVRITAPVGMAGQPLALALSPLLQAHPGLTIQIIADDEKRDLIAERIDVALRVGSLPDSTLVARKLGQTRMLLCAAPAYLARKGTPRTPPDSGDPRLALWRDAGQRLAAAG